MSCDGPHLLKNIRYRVLTNKVVLAYDSDEGEIILIDDIKNMLPKMDPCICIRTII